MSDDQTLQHGPPATVDPPIVEEPPAREEAPPPEDAAAADSESRAGASDDSEAPHRTELEAVIPPLTPDPRSPEAVRGLREQRLGAASPDASAESQAVTGEAQPLPEAEPLVARDLLPGMLMAAGVLLLVIVLLRHIRRRPQHSELDRDPTERIADLRETAVRQREPIEALMSDAEELSRRLAAMLDSKAARIEQLLEDADRRIEELNGQAPRRSSSDFSSSSRRPVREGRMPSTQDPMQREIYRLSDEGLAPVDIAQKLEQPVGQVELVLALRR